jgi:hypothetical protein
MRPDNTPDSDWRVPMKVLFLVALVSIGLNMGLSQSAESHPYQTPANNYYQNNWMSR